MRMPGLLKRLRRKPARLGLIAWNCGPGNHQVAATLRGWIAEYNPDGIVLSEAAAYHSILKDLDGYQLRQETPPAHAPRTNDTGDVAVLIRNDHEIRHRRVARMRRKWTFRKYDITHDPHRYENVRVKVRRRLWRLRASHWPTSGLHGPNRAAVVESAKASKRWLLAGLFIPSIDVGDLNEALHVLAEWFGRRFKVFGKGIDVAVTRNVKRCAWKELPKGGSDHHGRYYNCEA